MITLKDLCGKANFPEELSQFAIWDMDADRVAPVHLSGFFYRAKLVVSREAAKAAVETIALDISNANMQGFVHNDRLEGYRIASSPMLLGELRSGLEKLDLAERRCTFFSLIMGWSLERVSDLTWPEVKTITSIISDAAWDVLESLPRHLRSDLVFWRDTGNGVAKLADVRFKVEMAFGCDYDKLRAKFASMVFVDPELAAQEVRQHFGVDNI